MKTREWYVMQGFCPTCHKHRAAPGHVTCDVCLERARDSAKRRKARLKAAGVCVRCGKAPARDGYTMCFACAVKASEISGRSRARRGRPEQGVRA